MSYYVILPYANEDAVLIDKHPNGLSIDGYMFDEETPLSAEFPDGITYNFSAGKPKGIKLKAVVDNAMQLLIADSNIIALLEKEVSKFEFLPITIADHNNNVVSTDYSIAHCLEYIDCVDVSSCEFEPNPFDPETFFSWNKIVLKEELIGDCSIFKVPQLDTTIFISEELKKKIEMDDSISGIRFCKLEKYTSITF